MGNISTTVSIDISIKEGVVENINLGANCTPDEVVSYTDLFKEFRDVFAWSYEEMPGIDPLIIVHEIKTYPDVKPVWQKLCPVHPMKVRVGFDFVYNDQRIDPWHFLITPCEDITEFLE